jgi:hypothetical protein
MRTGVVVGFLLGLIFENVKETKQIAIKTWYETVSWGKSYKWDWKGTGIYFGVVFLFFLTMINWLFSTRFLGKYTSILIKEDSCLGILVFLTLYAMIACFIGSVILLLGSTVEYYRQLNLRKAHPKKVDSIKDLLKTLFWIQPQTLLLIGIICSIYVLYKLGWKMLIVVYNIPRMIRETIRLLARILNFLTLCLFRLISNEKKLAFAICTASGTALGLYLGREIVCGVSGSVVAGILILTSDKMRVWLEKKQGNCVCAT